MKETCLFNVFYTINPTSSGLALNPGLGGERQATNSRSPDTAPRNIQFQRLTTKLFRYSSEWNTSTICFALYEYVDVKELLDTSTVAF